MDFSTILLDIGFSLDKEQPGCATYLLPLDQGRFFKLYLNSFNRQYSIELEYFLDNTCYTIIHRTLIMDGKELSTFLSRCVMFISAVPPRSREQLQALAA